MYYDVSVSGYINFNCVVEASNETEAQQKAQNLFDSASAYNLVHNSNFESKDFYIRDDNLSKEDYDEYMTYWHKHDA